MYNRLVHILYVFHKKSATREIRAPDLAKQFLRTQLLCVRMIRRFDEVFRWLHRKPCDVFIRKPYIVRGFVNFIHLIKPDLFNYTEKMSPRGINRTRRRTRPTAQRVVHTLVSWMQKVCAISELVLNTGGGNVGCWLR